MKKILCIILILSFVFTIAGCSKIEHKDRGTKLNVCNLSKYKK